MNKDVIHTLGIKGDKKYVVGIDNNPNILGLESYVLTGGLESNGTVIGATNGSTNELAVFKLGVEVFRFGVTSSAAPLGNSSNAPEFTDVDDQYFITAGSQNIRRIFTDIDTQNITTLWQRSGLGGSSHLAVDEHLNVYTSHAESANTVRATTKNGAALWSYGSGRAFFGEIEVDESKVYLLQSNFLTILDRTTGLPLLSTDVGVGSGDLRRNTIIPMPDFLYVLDFAGQTIQKRDKNNYSVIQTAGSFPLYMRKMCIDENGNLFIGGAGNSLADSPGRVMILNSNLEQIALYLDAHTRAIFDIAVSTDSRNSIAIMRDSGQIREITKDTGSVIVTYADMLGGTTELGRHLNQHPGRATFKNFHLNLL